MTLKYLEDLAPGDGFGGERYAVARDEMIDFARKWDPRPIHLDDEAGRAAGFGCAIASGAYTTAIFTRLALASREADGGHAVIAGLGATMSLPNPVRAGDVLEFRAEVLEARPSKSRPDAGVVRMRARLCNQDGEPVYESTTATLVSRRPAS
ncbi:MAG: MaoC/PaaZ C-terminal domain-containing protein [Myxococcota bacterium]